MFPANITPAREGDVSEQAVATDWPERPPVPPCLHLPFIRHSYYCRLCSYEGEFFDSANYSTHQKTPKKECAIAASASYWRYPCYIVGCWLTHGHTALYGSRISHCSCVTILATALLPNFGRLTQKI